MADDCKPAGASRSRSRADHHKPPSYDPGVVDEQAAESLLAFAERAAADARGADAKTALAQIEQRLDDLSSASDYFISCSRSCARTATVP